MGIARKRVTQQSCATTDGLGVFTVVDNSPFTSFADLQSAPTLTTLTNAEGSQNGSYPSICSVANMLQQAALPSIPLCCLTWTLP
jgi:hypothetical protein